MQKKTIKRLQVLVSAFYCVPGLGSEEGVGWNLPKEIAKHHEVWVVTRAANRSRIEAEIARNPVSPTLHIVYYDLPTWLRWWAHGIYLERHLYYYLWQVCIYFLARQLHREVGFDLVHHVTFVKYWIPNFLALLPIPFVWGPVGGGESVPKAFWHDFSFRGRIHDAVRAISRWLLEHDPFLRLTTRRSVLAQAATRETADRMRKLGARDVQVFPAIGLPTEEIEQLSRYPVAESFPIRLISIGRLLYFKGFDLGLLAFARTQLPEVEYWIVGDGPERRRLEVLARRLGKEDRVRFWGTLPRDKTLAKLGECHILVHPSLRDSGGYVLLEAMAAGRAVICLDLGGSAVQVTEETGSKIAASNPEQVVFDLANSIAYLAHSPEVRIRMGEAGKRRVRETYDWVTKGRYWAELYEEILNQL